MKKLLIGSFVAFVLTFSALPAFAAIVGTPGLSVPSGASSLLSCGSGNFLSIYQSSTGAPVGEALSCTSGIGRNLGTFGIGTYVAVEDSANNVWGNLYNALASATNVSSVHAQTTPDFGSASVSSDITGSSFTDFLASIGDFMVTYLPAILTVLAALIGLGFLLTRVRRWIGKRA